MLARLRQIPAPTLTACSFSMLMHAGVAIWFGALHLAPPRFSMPTHIDVTLAPEPASHPSPRRAPRPKSAVATPRAPASPATAAKPHAATESAAVGAGDAEPTSAETPPFVASRYDVTTLHNPKPPYPLAARRRSQEGRVILQAHVREDGHCSEVQIKQSSGYELLDASALQTVQRWRFVPAMRGGAIVDSWVEIPIVFRLREDPVAMNEAAS
ncbi:MAG TPA: energy transducer TonB [Candidatus Methylomirabilis sp.]|nr:energy transducer TonB [Candidatus Methylomirabilis sp.]